MFKYKLLLLSFIILNSGFAQTKTYLNKYFKKVSSEASWEYYSIDEPSVRDTTKIIEKRYYKSGKLFKEITWADTSKRNYDGPFKEWYEDGQLREESYITSNGFEGSLKTYWPNGVVKRDAHYLNGNRIETKVYDLSGKEVPFYPYQTMPEYPGGLSAMSEYLSKNLKYPNKARRKKISGKVILKFIVDADGQVKNIEVEQSIHPLLDKEALRVVNTMPKWEPGTVDGTKVFIYYRLPINFKLSD